MAQKSYFGPLTFNNENNLKSRETETNTYVKETCICILCDVKCNIINEESGILRHLFTEHRLVIADVNLIRDLKAYLDYWRVRFRDGTLEQFCSTMLLNEKPDGTSSKDEKYYLLSDILPEDKELRSNLVHTKLQQVLTRHKEDREDKNYERECLFCRFISKDTRANYLEHLYEKHNLHIANPQKLVYIDELIDLLASKLDKLQCIFCEKTFKDRTVLKEHMRKKGHKRINPANKEYDTFFLSNYYDSSNNENSTFFRAQVNKYGKDKLAKNKTRHILKSETYDEEGDTDGEAESDPEWSDWNDKHEETITCLFCKQKDTVYINVLNHMKLIHNFDFDKCTIGLTFYNKVKIVNYIRRQMHILQCIRCELKFETIDLLLMHMETENHFKLVKSLWDQPEFYFPTYEDDIFLFFMEDDDESWWSGEEKEAAEISETDLMSQEMALSVLDN